MHFQYFLYNFQRMGSYTSGHPVWPLAAICVFARLRVVEKGADTFMSAPVFHILNIINLHSGSCQGSAVRPCEA